MEEASVNLVLAHEASMVFVVALSTIGIGRNGWYTVWYKRAKDAGEGRCGQLGTGLFGKGARLVFTRFYGSIGV